MAFRSPWSSLNVGCAGAVEGASNAIIQAGSNQYGERSRLLGMNSALPHIAGLTNTLWNEHIGITQTQNRTSFSGKRVWHTNALAVWDTSESSQLANFMCIPELLSKWTQLVTCPRVVFFGELDQGSAKSFAAILFGLTAVLLAQEYVIDVQSRRSISMEEDQRRSQVDANQSPSTCSASLPTSSGSGSGAPPDGPSWDIQAENGFIDPLELAESCMQPGAEEERQKLCAYIEGLTSNLRFQLLNQTGTPLLDKAAEYLLAANEGQDTFTIAVMESKFGQGSTMIRVVKIHSSSSVYVLALCGVFLMLEFAEHSLARFLADSCILLVLTTHICVGAFIEKQTLQFNRRGTMLGLGVSSLVWVLLFIGFTVDYSIIAFVRPVMFFTGPSSLVQELAIFLTCVWQVRTMLMFFFTVVTLAAEVCYVIWSYKLDWDGGDVVDDFYHAFVSVYVFLESVDNWVLNAANCNSAVDLDCFSGVTCLQRIYRVLL